MSYNFYYILIIVLIILYFFYYYLVKIESHQHELKRILILEKKMKQREFLINQARSLSVPCNIPDLNTPKECYLDSNYDCKWSTDAERCNLIVDV